MKILVIIAGTLVAFALFLLMLNQWGSARINTPHEFPFFSNSSSAGLSIAGQLEDVKIADQIYWLDIRLSADKKVFVLPGCYNLPLLRSFGESKISNLSFEQLKTQRKSLNLLSDFYQRFPHQKFMLNIIDNEFDIDTLVVDAIKDFNPDDRTLVISSAEIITKSIKKLKPLWVYGSSQSDLLRLKTYESLWILPAVSFESDVFVSPVKLMNRDAFNSEIINFLHARQIKTIIAPIYSDEEAALAHKYQVDYISNKFNCEN